MIWRIFYGRLHMKWKNRERFLGFLLPLFPAIFSFIVKFSMLNRFKFPPSSDYGNYLVQVNVLRGYDIRGFGLQYPPLYFIFLDLLLRIFDEFTSLKLMAALVFSIAAIPFFLLVKSFRVNDVLALISTWFFIFFEGYSEMIAWGGNQNFLGFSFMLLALFFFKKSLKNLDKRDIMLTGFFISLVVGTHFLVMAFLILFLLLFLVLNFVFNRVDIHAIVKVLLFSALFGLLFSLPYLPIYISCMRYFSADLIRPDIINHLNSFRLEFIWMFRETYFIEVIIAALSIYALIKYAKENKTDLLLLSSLFLTPLLLALSTTHPSRWLYFLPIPLFASFGLYLKGALTGFKNFIGRRRRLLAINAMAILILSVGATVLSINRLNTAVNYYQRISEDDFEALNWIKENTPPNSLLITSGPSAVIGGGGNIYSWWVEGYSKRKCIPAANLEFFSYYYEREEINLVNKILAGNHLMECGYIQLTEDFPSGGSNPGIALSLGSYYVKLLFLNDAAHKIVVSSPASNGNMSYRIPFYARDKRGSIESNASLLNTSFTYVWPDLMLYRSVTIYLGQFYVDIVFKAQSLGVDLKMFNVSFWVPPYMALEKYYIEGSSITLYLKDPYDKDMKAKVEFSSSSANLRNISVLLEREYLLPSIIFSLEPYKHSLHVGFRVSIYAGNLECSTSEINIFNSHEMIRKLGVNYILVNKRRADEYLRFHLDEENFEEVFKNSSVAIFKVKALYSAS